MSAFPSVLLSLEALTNYCGDRYDRQLVECVSDVV